MEWAGGTNFRTHAQHHSPPALPAATGTCFSMAAREMLEAPSLGRRSFVWSTVVHILLAHGWLEDEGAARLAVDALGQPSALINPDTKAPLVADVEALLFLPQLLFRARTASMPRRQARRAVLSDTDRHNGLRVAAVLLGLRRGCMLEGVGSEGAAHELSHGLGDFCAVVLHMDGCILVCRRDELVGSLNRCVRAVARVTDALPQTCTTMGLLAYNTLYTGVGMGVPLPMSFTPLTASQGSVGKTTLHTVTSPDALSAYCSEVRNTCSALLGHIASQESLAVPLSLHGYDVTASCSVVDAVWLVGFLLQYPLVYCGTSSAAQLAGPFLPDVPMQLVQLHWRTGSARVLGQAYSMPPADSPAWGTRSCHRECLVNRAQAAWRCTMSQQAQILQHAQVGSTLAWISTGQQPGSGEAQGSVEFSTHPVSWPGGLSL